MGKPSNSTGAKSTHGLHLTLGTKFILLTIVILAITMSVSAVIHYRSQLEGFQENLRAKAQSHGEFVASISMEALLSHDYITLNRYMSDVSRLQDVIYGVIIAPDGRPVTSYLNEDNRYIKAALDELEQRNVSAVLERVNANQNVSMVSFPLKLDDEPLASIVLGVDYARLTELARGELVRQLMSSATIIIFLSICIYFVFRYNALDPIGRLIRGSERVAAGNLDEPVLVPARDEFGTLADSFNTMMHRLKQSLGETHDAMEQLRDLNRTLEARVAERTARLELAQRIAQMGHWDLEPVDATINASAEIFHILGLDASEPMTPRRLLRRIHHDDRHAALQAIRRALDKQKGFEGEMRIIRPDGTERTVTFTAETSRDGASEAVRIFGILQDITERKAAEHAAQKALVDKVNAESANQAKSAFLANMSHEIRTPLTAIIGFAESLRDMHQSEDERGDAVRTIIDNGKHLLHVINEILDLSKIESQKLEVERMPTSLFDVVSDVESLMSLQARAKDLSFAIEHQYPLPRRIETDPTRLKQILLNLCSNAVKFTERGSVRLAIAYVPAEQRLRFTVFDTGIGIAQEQLVRLFEPFTQADSSTTRRFGGTGLGLYICRQLAEKLGGEITIQSVEGLGTRVDVSVATGAVADSDLVSDPAGAPRVSTPQPVAGGEAQVRGHVLLAEDSPDNQRLISLYLRSAGAAVTVAANGQQAVEQALAGDCDLVLMDMQMPIMDGVEATRWLRRSGYARPIVALTANAMKEDRDRCLDAGCNDFLTKPIDRDAFNRMLAQHLPHAQATARLGAVHREDEQSSIDTLTREFVAGLPERVATMGAALEAADWTALAAQIHKLKGIAGSFGYPDITQQAAAVESALRAEQYEHVDDLSTALFALIERVSTPPAGETAA